MLTIIVRGDEVFDEASQTFSTVGDISLDLEHSLVSLSKWEQIFEKPFLGEEEKTGEEVLKYIECMILTPNFPREVFRHFSQDNITQINDYIDRKMTATWFNEMPGGGRGAARETITAELIYYWMIQFQIPTEFENWHLNRLFTLIKVCNVKQSKPKKMSASEMAARNRELNAQRRQQYGTSG